MRGPIERLMALELGFAGWGPVGLAGTSFGLGEREVAQVVRTRSGAGILRVSCEQGRLSFDLEPKEFFETGRVAAKEIACDGS